MNKMQENAAKKTAHLPPEKIVCKWCGEQSASGSFKGYAHQWGPTKHRFIAKERDNA